MMALSGVRSSWLIVARKRDLVRFADLAVLRALLIFIPPPCARSRRARRVMIRWIARSKGRRLNGRRI